MLAAGGDSARLRDDSGRFTLYARFMLWFIDNPVRGLECRLLLRL